MPSLNKKIILSFAFISILSQAASFNLSGNYRFGSTVLLNPDLEKGKAPGDGSTTTFLEHRAILRPDVVVDDRFTVKSELSLLQNTLNSANQVGDNFGTPLDRSATQYNDQNMLYVRRAYLEWTNDWGIFKVGRQPKSWGLGILHDAGNDVFDDYGTTVDRVGFQAMLGNLTLNAGFEKGREARVKVDSDDSETYELSVEYNNPESLFDVGLLLDRNIRSTGAVPSSLDLSIFLQKRFNKVQVGTELVSVKPSDRPSTFGVLAQVDYLPGNWDLSFDTVYATAKSNETYFALHPNYQPFLLLYRQSLGAVKRDQLRGGLSGQGVGGQVGSGDGAGAVLAKLGAAYTFDSKLYTLGTNFGGARLLRQGSNAQSTLGYEGDFYFNHKWYENFMTSYAMGLLLPQKGMVASPKMAWGVQLRGALSF